MEKLHCRFIMYFFQACLLLCLGQGASSANVSDRLALISFKKMILEDPLGVTSSWNDSVHFCNWIGVTCSGVHHQRVTFLDLEGLKLAGSISPSIGNLTFLKKIKLEDNKFGGEIPQELGRLSRLNHLNLSHNSFSGRLPSNLSHCTKLKVLNAIGNHLVGSIAGIRSLNYLVNLNLGDNLFSGNIPPFLGNFSYLEHLILHQNNFIGRIPNEIGQVSHLKVFNVQDNILSGQIPSPLYNISSITWFSVGGNRIEGLLPSDIGFTLINLEYFIAGGNKFTGSIPYSFSNASRLRNLELLNNSFTGLVPKELGNLQGLVRLLLGSNQLGSKSEGGENLNVLTNLVNCTSLQDLGLEDNHLRGRLPNFSANFSTQLNTLALGRNLIHGSIPQAIEKLTKLIILTLEENFLSGKIPSSIGKIQNLQLLSLLSNNFSGTIPSSLGNLTKLIYLHISSNRLEGSLPSSLGKCQSLLVLGLDSNILSGVIPKQVFNLPRLVYFNVSGNFLYGSLPLEIGSLSNVECLAVSENRLSGNIPSTLSKCQKLEYLYMQGNSFEGMISKPLSSLNGLREADLSRNNLSGEIPQFLADFAFEYLNLSFNGFHGEVPIKGTFTNASIVSLNGNMGICGGIPELHLSECRKRASSRNTSRKTIAVVVSGVSLVILFLLIFSLYWLSNKRNRTSANGNEDWPLSVSYSQLFKSTNGFSSDCLLGAGSYGSVYRGSIHDGGPNVAVKVLHLQQRGASKSFIAECKAMKNIRHRNLVKIVTICSSVDFQGNDFKALIFEFMANGSLEKWLHPAVDELNQFGTCLSVAQRLNIAVDVAFALEYLHHHNEMPIAHCDLKPSNVLLDNDMIAHIGDFGLAKFLLATTHDSSGEQCLSSGLKGSIGYIPPEYGTGGQVSIFGDVYCYGILLLEMFTGKSPTDEMFQDGLDLHEFSKMAFTERLTEVLDPLCFSPTNADTSGNDVRNNMQECVVEVIRIGLSCSMPSTSERPTMAKIVKKLVNIRNLYSEFHR